MWCCCFCKHVSHATRQKCVPPRREKPSGGSGEVTSWRLSLSTSSTYLIPSMLPSFFFPNLLSCLSISPSPSLSPHLPLYLLFFFKKTFFYKRNILFLHLSTSLSFPLLPLPFPPILQLQSVSMSLVVNRSSIKANLNFILSVTGELIVTSRQRLPLSFTIYSWLGLLPVSFLSALPIMLLKGTVSQGRSDGLNLSYECVGLVMFTIWYRKTDRNSWLYLDFVTSSSHIIVSVILIGTSYWR